MNSSIVELFFFIIVSFITGMVVISLDHQNRCDSERTFTSVTGEQYACYNIKEGKK